MSKSKPVTPNRLRKLVAQTATKAAKSAVKAAATAAEIRAQKTEARARREAARAVRESGLYQRQTRDPLTGKYPIDGKIDYERPGVETHLGGQKPMMPLSGEREDESNWGVPQ